MGSESQLISPYTHDLENSFHRMSHSRVFSQTGGRHEDKRALSGYSACAGAGE